MDRLWVDKHRPSQIEHLDYHPQLSELLVQLASSWDFPHLLVYGPGGSGKKTRIMAFLQQLFNTEFREFKSKTTTQQTECRVVSSNHHIEVTPAECEHADRLVVQQLIKEIGSTKTVVMQSGPPLKVVIINEADRLSSAAQASLRRTMEKHTSRCRIIMVASNLGRIMLPLRSRCLMIRVPAPSPKDIQNVLQKTSLLEGISLDTSLITNISNNCECNLRRAILQLQEHRMTVLSKQPQTSSNNQPQWRRAISLIATELVTNQSAATIKKVREYFYDLLTNCVPADEIIRCLLQDLMEYIPTETQKKQILKYAASHEALLQQGSKHIFHLEAFACKVMLCIKGLVNSFEEMRFH